MSEDQQSHQDNSCVDAFAAVIMVTIFVISAVYWISSQ